MNHPGRGNQFLPPGGQVILKTRRGSFPESLLVLYAEIDFAGILIAGKLASPDAVQFTELACGIDGAYQKVNILHLYLYEVMYSDFNGSDRKDFCINSIALGFASWNIMSS